MSTDFEEAGIRPFKAALSISIAVVSELLVPGCVVCDCSIMPHMQNLAIRASLHLSVA